MNDSTLCINDRQEPFSVSYICAIATAAGYGVEIHNTATSPDRKSIDLTITQYGMPDYSDLKIQAKCTYHHNPKDDYIPFVVNKKNYNDIRRNKSPHLLIVVNVPRSPEEWIIFNENSSILSYNCYYYSLRGLDEIDTETKTLKIPLSNKFDTCKLNEIMNLLYGGKFIIYDNTIVNLPA